MGQSTVQVQLHTSRLVVNRWHAFCLLLDKNKQITTCFRPRLQSQVFFMDNYGNYIPAPNVTQKNAKMISHGFKLIQMQDGFK